MDLFDKANLDSFRDEINRKRLAALNKIANLPIAILIWGPNPFKGSITSECRMKLKEALNGLGHHACFSEELYDPKLGFSNVAQQVAQAEAFDIVLSIPDSPGSIAEIHDFARVPRISSKIVTFLNQDWNDGYANKALIELESIATTRVQLYKEDQLPNFIIDSSIDHIRRLQEVYYILGRRIN